MRRNARLRLKCLHLLWFSEFISNQAAKIASKNKTKHQCGGELDPHGRHRMMMMSGLNILSVLHSAWLFLIKLAQPVPQVDPGAADSGSGCVTANGLGMRDEGSDDSSPWFTEWPPRPCGSCILMLPRWDWRCCDRWWRRQGVGYQGHWQVTINHTSSPAGAQITNPYNTPLSFCPFHYFYFFLRDGLECWRQVGVLTRDEAAAVVCNLFPFVSVFTYLVCIFTHLYCGSPIGCACICSINLAVSVNIK